VNAGLGILASYGQHGAKRPIIRRKRHGRDDEGPAPAALHKARELMEGINAEAGKHNVWVRTQANAPAQRPWFSETSGEGSASSRRAASPSRR